MVMQRKGRTQTMASTRQRLSPEAIWEVINSSSDTPSRELALKVGSTYSAIHNLRWKLTKKPWTCRVSWQPCQECGEPLIRPTSRKRYHDECRPAALKRLNASYEVNRSERLTDDQIEARNHRRDEYYSDNQAKTLPRAHSKGRRWTDQEYEYLLANADTMRLPDIAMELGRTYAATQTRLKMLRDRSR